MPTPGHLFVIDGDLTKVACDALLIPTDANRRIEKHWDSLFVDRTKPPGREFSADERVQKLEPADVSASAPDVWLSQFGHRGGATNKWYADGIAAFVQRAGDEYEPIAGVPRRVAVNVAGSGAGGAQNDKGTLIKTIVPRLVEAAQEHEIDVVLVCWGRRQYDAAQRARRDVEGVTPVWLTPDIARLADRAREGDLVLFVGAGVSMGAGLGSWSDLIGELANAANLEQADEARLRRLDIRDQAAILANRLEPEQYKSTVTAAVSTTSRYALGHGLLASLGCTENVTTNYDTLFESALVSGGRGISVLPYEPVDGSRPWLLKLHGSVDKSEHMVLTRSEYLGQQERAGALFGILQAMLMTRHMLFVGYSLTDDSFHRVIHEVRRARSGTGDTQTLGTALLLNGDPLLQELWEKDLEFVLMSPEIVLADEAEAKQQLAVNARELDIFLDRVCLMASDVSSFLLDETYGEMLHDDEKLLRADLQQALVRATDSSSPTAEHVVAMLRALGSESK
jgi:hypothetical protein